VFPLSQQPTQFAGPQGAWHVPFPPQTWPFAAQSTHAAPPRPHCVAVGGRTQVLLEQHPLGQVWALHGTMQVRVEGSQLQAWHCWPPLPQAVFVLPGRQTLPEQHPKGQVAGPHDGTWQAPLTHVSLPLQLRHWEPNAPQA
jgi:hypothetical protein